ncbi:MAG: hypothetical protein OCU17_08215 [Methanophagales archaeon]|nr:hypothetical protein [Methanophagales archaeon]
MSYKSKRSNLTISNRSVTATGMPRDRDRARVVMLDFGGQYSHLHLHLIARRCTDPGVYTEYRTSTF